MPFKGNGTFARLYNWGADRDAGINITASRFDGEDNDFASGLSACLTRDGQGSGMTGPLSITLALGTTPLTIKGNNGTSLAIDKTGSGYGANILGLTAGVLRWTMSLGNNAAESGSNAGSDFTISRCTDAGAFIDTPLTISRSNGYATMSAGNLTLGNTGLAANVSCSFQSAAGNARALYFYTGGTARWALVTDSVAESGSNAGSNFEINRYNDAGAFIGSPLTITRSSGAITTGNAIGMNTVAGQPNNLSGNVGNVGRWIIALGNGAAESGGNVGSDFSIASLTDAGAFLATPLTIARANGVATFSQAIVNGPSDRSMKENIAPLEGSLDKVLALQGVGFNMIGEDKRRHIGLIAQDVAPVVPEVIQEYRSGEDEPKLALDYPKLTALLIESVKTLTARIEALEKHLA